MKRRIAAGVTIGLAVAFATAVTAWKTGLARRVYIRITRGPAPEIEENPIPNPRIVVDKKARRLELLSDGQIVKTFRIGLGFGAGKGDKVKKGDGRTPEGDFYVCGKNRRSFYGLALNLSYPNIEDADRGLRDGLIDEKQHRGIVEAIEGRSRPPWDTPLGGAILIHACGAHRDWTLGCVALDDDDMLGLYEAVPVGTTVTIHP